MNISHHTTPRPARLLLWLGLALLAAFVGLALFMKFAARWQRPVSDAELLAELADATLQGDPAPTPDDWPQWRGQFRDGVGSLPGMPRRWPESGPTRLWRSASAGGYSSFAVSAGKAYTMFGGEGDQERVVCLDAATGKEVWAHDRQLTASPSGGYGGPRATPTLQGDRLWTVSSDGVLLCLRQKDGKPLWQSDLRDQLGARMPQWGFASSPLVQGDLVYVTPGGTKGRCLAAFNKDTGELAWASQDDPAGYSSPVAATIAGVPQVLFFTGKRLLGVTPDEGKLLWEFSWPTFSEVNAATPLVIHARSGKRELTYVFISSGYKQGCALVKIEERGKGGFRARPVYTNDELCCHFASPVRYKDHIYGLDETRDLTCLDLRTGEVPWRFDKPPEEADALRRASFKKGSLLRVEDVLIVLGEEGKLALVEATPKEYRELAAARPFRERDRFWSMPALADGRLLLRNQRNVVCLDLRGR